MFTDLIAVKEFQCYRLVMKNIHKYRDYRLFLRDYYQYKKKTEQGFTYAKFAAKAKLNSPNYLKLVIDNKRNLTISNIHAFAKCLNLTGGELDFFEALVLENQSESKDEKSFYKRRLKTLVKVAGNKEVERKTSNNSIDNTSRVALKLFSEGKSTDEILKMSQVELKISETEARDLLESLIESNELIPTTDETYALKASHVMNSDPKSFNQAQKVFLSDGLLESKRVFDERYTDNTAKFLSILFTAKAASLPYMFSDLREAFEQVANKYEPEPTEECGVYRAQFQLYRFRKNEQ